MMIYLHGISDLSINHTDECGFIFKVLASLLKTVMQRHFRPSARTVLSSLHLDNRSKAWNFMRMPSSHTSQISQISEVYGCNALWESSMYTNVSITLAVTTLPPCDIRAIHNRQHLTEIQRQPTNWCRNQQEHHRYIFEQILNRFQGGLFLQQN